MTQSLAQLEKLLQQSASATEAFDQALTGEAIKRTKLFLTGLRAYQRHPAHRADWFARREKSCGTIIWQSGTTCLRDYNTQESQAPIVLVIPSLINRYDILDLDHNASFLRSMAQQGLRPLVVDWNVPGEDEKNFSLNDYVTRRLIPVLDFIDGMRAQNAEPVKKKNSFGPAEPQNTNPGIHILGYCMGGLLALALATLRPQHTRTLTLLATPWDFHQPNPAIGAQFLTLADQMEPTLKAMAHLPVDIIQSLFATFQPLQALTKFTAFAAMESASAEARQFVLLEDWLNDGVPLTAPVARECLRDWYGENRTAKTEWHIDGRIIDPCKLTMPSYIVVPGKDLIVPPESALPLARLLPRHALHEPMAGHIGMIVSQKSPQQVWAPLFHWLTQHA